MDVALIVVRSVESGISRRCRIDILRECVCGLEIALCPSPGYRCLQCVVDRVCVVGENLIAAVPIQSRCRGARDRIGERIGADGVRMPGVVSDGERMLQSVY